MMKDNDCGQVILRSNRQLIRSHGKAISKELPTTLDQNRYLKVGKQATLQLRGKYLIAVAAKGALANFQKLLPIGKKMLSNSISPLNGTRQMSRRFAIQSVCDIELKAFHDFIFLT